MNQKTQFKGNKTMAYSILKLATTSLALILTILVLRA